MANVKSYSDRDFDAEEETDPGGRGRGEEDSLAGKSPILLASAVHTPREKATRDRGKIRIF